MEGAWTAAKLLGPGLAIGLSLYGLFKFAESEINEDFRKEVSKFLKNLKTKSFENQWPQIFLEIFNGVFHESAISWRFIRRSIIASLATSLVTFLVLSLLFPDAADEIISINIRHPLMLIFTVGFSSLSLDAFLIIVITPFISTFFTSIWVWAFAISTFFLKLLKKSSRFLPYDTKPLGAIGTVSLMASIVIGWVIGGSVYVAGLFA